MSVPRRFDAVPGTPERIGGRFIVEALLGKGGMASVYRVRDETTGQRLALKQATLWSEDAEAMSLRFRREFHTMASLRHPRIVEVFDFGIDKLPYYTMELLDGQDLHDLDGVPPRRACEILRDVATALAFLHTRGLLHRDLAPRNVRCTSDGRAKLIDFGVLATTGVIGDIAGTAPLMAPEIVHGRPLDHRYDLYGLGALAYRILTGRHAFPARTIEYLDWSERPEPPSALASGIPPALDELVLALLAHDPLARPASAAEVIDRLSAIGELDASTDVESQRHGWIASASLVGRHREMEQIKRAVTRAHDGIGRSLLIEAPSGIGKSRLLRELGLEAQLAGLCVARTESDAAGRGPYGILHELAKQLLVAMPKEAEAAARSRGPTLARVIPSLRNKLGVKPETPKGDPPEDRMHLQASLASWILEIAASRPIALLVDDVQRCDEASAAVLAVLSHQARDHKLLIGAALRTDEAARAPAAIASMIDGGQRQRLRGLDQDDVGELCRSLFGDVLHIPRLAQWIHKVAGGSPLYTTELARHLVDRGVIRYLDGQWVIPEDPNREDIPTGLADAMDARVRSLPGETRALGEALSIHGGDLSLDLIVSLADTDDEGRVFAALDKLAFEEVLIQATTGWRFRHDGLREAMLRSLADERKRALHLRVGEALAKSGAGNAERQAEIGWHLLRGGDPVRGAVLLEKAGRALFDAQSFFDSIAPLEAALAVIDQDRRGSPRVRLQILHMLLTAGCMADRKAAVRHAEACVNGHRYWAGVDVATRARNLVGKHLGVLIGLTWAVIRWVLSRGRGPNPYRAFQTYFIVVGYSSSIYSLMFDYKGTQAIIDRLEPVAILKNRVPYAVYLMTINLQLFPQGRFGPVRRNCNRILEILEHDRITPLRETDRRTGIGGAQYMLALLAVVNLDPTWEEELEKLVKLEMKFFEVGAAHGRILYHRMRGEEETAAELEARIEILFVQLGSVWQMEAFIPVLASFAYAFARDMLGLRRTIEHLSRLCRDGFLYEPFLALARGEYLRERGDPHAALLELEPLAERDDYPTLQVPALPALAETLLVLGHHARAKQVAEKGLALSIAEETYNFQGKLRSARAIALADAAMGAHADAARRLDKAIAEALPHASPVMSGALHEARARVALSEGDFAGFQQHLTDTEDWFRRSLNPALIARGQRLSETGMRHTTRVAGKNDDAVTQRSSSGAADAVVTDVEVVSKDAFTTPQPTEVRNWVAAVLSGCRGSAERAQRALELVVSESHGGSGYLFLRYQRDLVLAAPAWGDEPPAGLAHALGRAIDSSEAATIVDAKRPEGLAKIEWKAIPLTWRFGDRSVVIGGVAVIASALPLVDPNPTMLEEIARELFEAGDVTPKPHE